MTLESIMNPQSAVKSPMHMFFVGLLYATVGMFLSIWIFKSNASMVMVFLTVIAALPLMYNTMRMEEEADIKLKDEKSRLKEHGRVLKYLGALFLGFVLAFSLWYVILPASLVQSLFSVQLDTIGAINANSGAVGSATSAGDIFLFIFLNNIKVLLFSIFFAFFFGAGAIFILTWNASVISAAIGAFVKEKIATYALSVGSLNAFNYFHLFSLGLLRYFIHGIPEMMAYFIGGLAGGIISVAMINHDLETDKFRGIMKDVMFLVLISIGILVIAGLMEVYLTPIFF